MRAETPFKFVTSSYLVRIGNQRATTLLEMQAGLEDCSDGSIFCHTYQTLGHHHFLTEGFSNDFAEWIFSACNRPRLAEQLASIDIRDYVSLPGLRAELLRLVRYYCRAEPREAKQAAFEPFYFAETIEQQIPLADEAWTLDEFRDTLTTLSHASIQFHFITSRLRLHLRTNDFSYWLQNELDLKELARSVNQIDIYTNTLDSARLQIVSLIEREPHR